MLNQLFFEKLAKTLKYHRKRSGLTRNKLADMAGVGKTVIYDIEHMKKTVRLNTLVKVLDILNISIELTSPLMHELGKEVDENS